ncbi:hypothetical protein GCM10009430_26400 [Aquimarina litoralis]|uniref:Por secretion system C-terminal sorting domain-containing protein n=1 Tax=Aquimarina litoralis TaxID=584605 RepID=A0ABN1IXE1_9FLAO
MKKYCFLLAISFLISAYTNLRAQKINLPIEVFGLPENIAVANTELEGLSLKRALAEIRFTIDQSMYDRIRNTNNLYLQINNASYDEKVSISVNHTTFTSLHKNNTSIYPQELARGGMVHGGYNTIRLHFTSTDLKVGQNSIRFRMKISDGISNGYRIIDLDLVDSGGARILKNSEYYLPANQVSEASRVYGASYFNEDDPLTWTNPYTESGISISQSALLDSIYKGKSLWYYGRGGDFVSETAGEDLWSNYLTSGNNGFWYGYDLGNSRKIKAKCTDCHTHDGRDLEIFSYSNKAIVERSKFHRLTEEEGKLIAAYIRSLSDADGNKNNIHRYGRPWNPPYQPGTELKDKPINEWSAGAGLEAVLGNDSDMAPYLFGKSSGFTQADMDAFFDADKSPETYTLPLPIQFPDWKHWLPMIHPMDAYTKNNFYQTTYDDRTPFVSIVKSYLNPQKGYEVFRELLESYATNSTAVTKNINLSSLSQDQINELMQGHVRHRVHYRFFQAQVLNSDNENMSGHWRTRTGDGLNSIADHVPQVFAATSMARLMAVKNFEFMNEFSLQNQAANYLNPEDNPSDHQWFVPDYDSKHVFEIPPHLTGCLDEGGCQNFMGQPRETGQYESTAWYQLQMILTPGYGVNYGNGPVDFNYQPEFILSSSKSSGINQPLRYFHTINNMYQVKTWSGDTNPNDARGFRIRVMGPWYFFGKEADAGASQLAGHAPLEFVKSVNEIEGGMLPLILNAQLKQFLKEINKPRNRLYIVDNSDFSSSNENWWRYDNMESIPGGPASRIKGGNGSQNLDSWSKTEIFDVTKAISTEEPMYADHIYWALKSGEELGADCGLLNEVKDWAKRAWPNINKLIIKHQNNILGEETISWDTVLSCNILSTDEVAHKIVGMYPNPVTNRLYLDGFNQGNNKYFIYNILGQQFLSGTISEDLYTIDVSLLNAGPYFIKIKNKTDSNVFKFIKQ